MAKPTQVRTESDPSFATEVEGVERKLRADAQRNRASILDAAEAEFRAHGVDASMDEIAHRAGVGVGTVYRNFPTKEALLQAIVATRLEPLLDAAREAASADDAGEAFFAFLRRLSDESAAFKALADRMAASGFDLTATKKDVMRELLGAVGQLLARAQRYGRVRSDISIDDVSMLMAGLGQAGYSASDPSLQSRCVELVCDALRTDMHTSLFRDADVRTHGAGG
ncbi:MAG TPA: helix-turn-helix domain-containing protein [Candidatus Acidoferrales bacterium]|nr:helix-turn-helix domain-containing protein [Candidatus Acidoferrales bacterium]